MLNKRDLIEEVTYYNFAMNRRTISLNYIN